MEVTQNAKNNLPVHHRELVDHDGASGIVSPNNDTLYSGVSLDMSQSPQTVELPPLKEVRYQSMMATDMRAYNIAEFVNIINRVFLLNCMLILSNTTYNIGYKNYYLG